MELYYTAGMNRKYLVYAIIFTFSFHFLHAESCPQEKHFIHIYKQHLLTAKMKQEKAYRALRTKASIDAVETQLAYFKKNYQPIDFMTLVKSSVKTDPEAEDLTIFDCKVNRSKARVIYKGSEENGQVTMLILMFQKEAGSWKMGEYGINEIDEKSVRSFISEIDRSPYLKTFRIQ